ncbi:MAG TPA: hypothetical protein VGN72_21480 [Tepidisphaeraceae bacterium]|jgi:hypothetical protein|nr:hypothetical protein [Tepidisphaeraceae bacterium]
MKQLTHFIAIPLLAVLAVTGAGCAQRAPAVQTTTLTSPDGQQVVRLANDMIEVIVEPAKGRITEFRFIGGPNVLWVNPQSDLSKDAWKNWGGDKVWLWPQADWEKRNGKAWPPPGDPPKEPYTVRTTKDGLVMTSPVIDAYGVRIVRELSLVQGQPRMTVVNRVEVVDPAKAHGVGLWTVTQLPVVDEVIVTPLFARSPGGLNSAVYPKAFEEFKGRWPAPQPSPIGLGDVIFTRPPTSAKVGIEADKMRVKIGDTFFMQQAAFSPKEGPLDPAERAQLYTQPDEPAGSGYVELEFITPIWDAKQLAAGSLTVTWTLWRPPG